jgi:hypothetical protein
MLDYECQHNICPKWLRGRILHPSTRLYNSFDGQITRLKSKNENLNMRSYHYTG